MVSKDAAGLCMFNWFNWSWRWFTLNTQDYPFWSWIWLSNLNSNRKVLTLHSVFSVLLVKYVLFLFVQCSPWPDALTVTTHSSSSSSSTPSPVYHSSPSSCTFTDGWVCIHPDWFCRGQRGTGKVVLSQMCVCINNGFSKWDYFLLIELGSSQ